MDSCRNEFIFDIFVRIILNVTLTFALKIKVAIASSMRTEKVTSESFQSRVSIIAMIPTIMNISPNRVTIPEESISFRLWTSVVTLVIILPTGFLSKYDIGSFWIWENISILISYIIFCPIYSV